MLQEFLDMFNDPHARHAMVVHLPIAGSMLAILLTLAWAVTRFRATGLAVAAAILFVCASIGAAMAANAGEAAADRLEGAGLSTAEHAALEKHEELGERGWIWPLIPAALIGLGLTARAPVPKQVNRIRVALGAIGIIAGLGVGAWVASAAHEGGQLVYRHGLGVPARGAGPVAAAPPSTELRDHDDDD